MATSWSARTPANAHSIAPKDHTEPAMFLPIGTERPRKRPTLITYWLIGICCAVFMWQTLMNRNAVGGTMSDTVSRFVLNFDPAVYSSQGKRVDVPRETLAEFGLPVQRSHHWYQYLTYQFLHGGIWHLLGNMLFLWVFGPPVEDRLGRLGFSAFYLVGGVVAALAHLVFADTRTLEIGLGTVVLVPSVLGASGSIAAVTGAFLVLFPKVNIRVLLFFFIIGVFSLPAWMFIAFAVVKDLVFSGMGGGVAYEAHLGGYAFGFAVIMALLGLRVIKREPMYDLFSIGKHAHRRRQYKALREKHGDPYNRVRRDPVKSAKLEAKLEAEEKDREVIAEKRSVIADLASEGKNEAAASQYLAFASEHAGISAGRDAQLAIANHLFEQGDHVNAADAYRIFLDRHKQDTETQRVRVMLALINARYLNDPIEATRLLDAVEQDVIPSEFKDLVTALRNDIV